MIDRSISYDDLKGLADILRLNSAGNRTAAKPNKPRPKTYLYKWQCHRSTSLFD